MLVWFKMRRLVYVNKWVIVMFFFQQNIAFEANRAFILPIAN